MPSNADIRPTRLEYLRTKKRIKIAQKGLKLLKLKRQALILEFFSISKASSRLRGELNAELIKGYQSIRMAEMIDGEMRLENEAMKIPQLKKLSITPKNVMGVKIPRLEGGRREEALTDYLLEIPVSISEAMKAFQEVHKIVLDVAEKETTLRKLLYEIDKTKRKANAIENVFIPRLEGGRREELLTDYLLEIPVSISEAMKAFQEVHKIVLDVAEKETTLRKLLYEIDKTKRKANAIENVFIPRLESAVKFITFRLEEMERDTFAMLKTVKRKMEEREKNVEVEVIAN